MAEFKLSRIRFTWKGNWASNTSYTKDDIVRFSGKSYVCLVGHSSSPSFYTDLEYVNTAPEPDVQEPKWELWFDGRAWRGNWNVNTFYDLGDVVRYGATVYLCTQQHTSAATNSLGLEGNIGNWTPHAIGSDWLTNWGVSVRYKVGDVVKFNGIVYRCIIRHTSAPTFALGLEEDSEKWETVVVSDNWLASWTQNIQYKFNDVVKYGGKVFRCVVPHLSTGASGFGLEADAGSWTLVNDGIEYRGTWAPATRYRVNDLVKYGANVWICIDYHVTTASFEEEKWEIYISGFEFESVWSNVTQYQPGDVVRYGGYTYYSTTNNSNKVPNDYLDDWNLLTTNFRIKGEWVIDEQYLLGDVVRRNGYLYVAVANSLAQETTQTEFWKLVIPSVDWRGAWDENITYLIGDVVTYIGTSYRCLQKHVSTSGNNPLDDVSNTYWAVYTAGDVNNRLKDRGDILTVTAGLARLPIGINGTSLVSSGIDAVWRNFNQTQKVYYVSTDGVDSPTAGTTLNSPFRTIKYACSVVTGPATISIKGGQYYEDLPISIPAGVSLVGDELRSTSVFPIPGEEESDMFYVRNATGIRNMTLGGLSGTLGPLNSFLTRRPSAGAYVSLDPGTGNSDESVWITNKSPYIQNVTTFGTGCIGLKIDGSLHNGGNRSIVANDFTQVLSDGIGVWCINNALTELVSVFSYYGHIGYLAENGGKIRATNGNSSYGTYGCVSEGVDGSETPLAGTINNRRFEAQVASVFAGQANNQILILEYSNAGREYSSASFTFTGAGTGISTSATDFRNNAVYEVRIIQTARNSPAGGGGYLNVGNNAQTGDPLSVTIATNDQNEPEQYEGMRVILTSGTGVGQYGYIDSYDFVSKVATVYKESDGTPGWDHVVPGSAIELTLDTTTVYSIEPRVTFSVPEGAGGIRALGRARVASGRIGEIKIWNPGSGYLTTPTVTITDPNTTSEVVTLCRVGNGVLAQPTFLNRGNGYQTSTTTCEVSGNGFADIYQIGKFLNVSGLAYLPGPGANLVIDDDTTLYKIVAIQDLTGGSARLQVSPELIRFTAPEHATLISVRERYSQVRLTGHDFLDIGTGNFAQTNYPNVNEFNKSPENEVLEVGGGRCFYTSTDQDGNFRVGELFKVEQSTGIVTISADTFNLSGLEELSLGGVSVGGSAVVIREFSTDATFTADSNNIIPTQRAIKAYLARRISGGGADAQVGVLIAGTVRVGPISIGSTIGYQVKIPVPVKFNRGVTGDMLVWSYFADSFSSD